MLRGLPVLPSAPTGTGPEPAGPAPAPPAAWVDADAYAADATARTAGVDARPHVVAWNLTRRCNLACAHCYISAGSWHGDGDELATADVFRIADEIFELAPAPMFILTGGEPLLREDLERIAEHGATRGATVVVGTNGTRLTRDRIASLQAAGVTGIALSIDSLDPRYHDRFRHGDGALRDTLTAVERLGAAGLDFVVQTTLTRGNRRELAALVAWAAERQAVAFNLYFLVATGRATGMEGLSPAENEDVLAELIGLERAYRGRMMVRSKCQPQIMRHAYDADPDSPLLNYATRCPCGVHYARITPEGGLTPCPYMPLVAGDLTRESFADVWRRSPVLTALRTRTPDGKCGRCGYREICGGCRARAYADTGDALAADASCAYEPVGEEPPVARRRPVMYGMDAPATLAWTAEARARTERIPGFVRGVVVARVEKYARERGHACVTVEVMDEVRRALPVDFARIGRRREGGERSAE